MIYPDVAYQGRVLVRMRAKSARYNNNWRARCGCEPYGNCSTTNHGQSYMNVDYNYGTGRPSNYMIQVITKRYGKDLYGTDQNAWEKFINAAGSYGSAGGHTVLLGGPGAPGRGFYFPNGNNNTPGPRTGTLGLGIFDKTGNRLISWALWYFDAGWDDEWRNQWYRCGIDYDIWFEDNI